MGLGTQAASATVRTLGPALLYLWRLAHNTFTCHLSSRLCSQLPFKSHSVLLMIHSHLSKSWSALSRTRDSDALAEIGWTFGCSGWRKKLAWLLSCLIAVWSGVDWSSCYIFKLARLAVSCHWMKSPGPGVVESLAQGLSRALRQAGLATSLHHALR